MLDYLHHAGSRLHSVLLGNFPDLTHSMMTLWTLQILLRWKKKVLYGYKFPRRWLCLGLVFWLWYEIVYIPCSLRTRRIVGTTSRPSTLLLNLLFRYHKMLTTAAVNNQDFGILIQSNLQDAKTYLPIGVGLKDATDWRTYICTSCQHISYRESTYQLALAQRWRWQWCQLVKFVKDLCGTLFHQY